MKAKDDEERSEFLSQRERMWLFGTPEAKPLRDKLFSIGGDFVVPREEPDLKILIERGQQFTLLSPTKIVYEHIVHHEMENGECHKNVADLFLSSMFDASIATGFALSYDGVWRQHSWLVTDDGKIVETTDLRKHYFGVKLTKEESELFCFRELDIE